MLERAFPVCVMPGLASCLPELAPSFANALCAPGHCRDQRGSSVKPHGAQLAGRRGVPAWLAGGATLSVVCSPLSGTQRPLRAAPRAPHPGVTGSTQRPQAGGRALEGRSPEALLPSPAGAQQVHEWTSHSLGSEF